jgi:hypothetical protein
LPQLHNQKIGKSCFLLLLGFSFSKVATYTCGIGWKEGNKKKEEALATCYYYYVAKKSSCWRVLMMV